MSTAENMWAPLHLRKIFVGGLDYSTTDDKLKEHFAKYGDVVDAVVMKDSTTSRSRGFGFVTYTNPEHVDEAQKARPHKVDGRVVETKRAVPRTENGPNNIINPINTMSSMLNHSNTDTSHTRLFVGGLPQEVKEEELQAYFAHFGTVSAVNIMYDKATGRHRGFAFVDYPDYDPVDKVLLTSNHSMKGKPIDVKKALSQADIGKMKGLMSGMVAGGTQETSFMAAMMGSLTSTTTQNMGGMRPSGNNVTNGIGRSGGLGGNSIARSGLNRFPGSGNFPGSQNALQFFPRLPMAGMPGFSAQLNSGWQYSVSGNAEVLRNTTGAASDRPSGAPLHVNRGVMGFDSDLNEDSMETEIWGGGGTDDTCPSSSRLLILEPFYGGSHKQLITTLRKDESFIGPEDVALFTLPSKKWHWRARTSALHFYQKIPVSHNFEVLFASSTLNLAEMIAIRPDLYNLRKILYFHENALVYPVRQQKERDFQYGYNQILSCLVADVIVFNSTYNLESFLREIPQHLKLQPDCRPDPHSIVETIRERSQVLYFPVSISHKTRCPKDALEPLHIIWPHRWEHDKDPDSFFQCLYLLCESGLNFRVSVLGESYTDNPPAFNEAKQRLANYIIHWGFAENKERYWEVLHSGDVVVSTAHHEFFGVAMLEAVGAGCFPLCPNRLVYPEIYPQECLYNTTNQLHKILVQWCSRPQIVRSKKVNIDLNSFSWATLRNRYSNLLS